jgi:hypothetical protein
LGNLDELVLKEKEVILVTLVQLDPKEVAEMLGHLDGWELLAYPVYLALWVFQVCEAPREIGVYQVNLESLARKV